MRRVSPSWKVANCKNGLQAASRQRVWTLNPNIPASNLPGHLEQKYLLFAHSFGPSLQTNGLLCSALCALCAHNVYEVCLSSGLTHPQQLQSYPPLLEGITAPLSTSSRMVARRAGVLWFALRVAGKDAIQFLPHTCSDPSISSVA